MIDKILEKIKDKDIAILGFGREGRSSYEFIRKHLPSKHITIIDKNDFSEELKSDSNLSFVSGDDYLEGLNKYDLVFKTPGISLFGIDTSDVKITSQIELLLEVHRDKVVGITGTKGKSTTTSLTYQILKQNGVDCVLTGNIGIPTFDLLEDATEDTYFVIEMSSHQLETLEVSPHIGVILNLFQDHLDHTGSVEEYHKAKLNIFKYQEANDYMIYYKDNETLLEKIKNGNYKGKELTVSTNSNADIYLENNTVIYHDELVFDKNLKRNLLGEHNFINIMVAFMIGKIFEIETSKILEVVSGFKSLEFRLEHFATIDGVKYYVDTLATIPEATLEAIEAIPDINTLIFGGMDRGISYEGFADALKNSKVEHFICMPKTGYEIAKDLPKEKVILAETLEEASRIAKEVTKKGTSCILSPAAASYEYFKNYEEKGNKFKEYIEGK